MAGSLAWIVLGTVFLMVHCVVAKYVFHDMIRDYPNGEKRIEAWEEKVSCSKELFEFLGGEGWVIKEANRDEILSLLKGQEPKSVIVYRYFVGDEFGNSRATLWYERCHKNIQNLVAIYSKNSMDAIKNDLSLQLSIQGNLFPLIKFPLEILFPKDCAREYDEYENLYRILKEHG